MGGSNLMSAIAGRVLLIPKGNYDSTVTYTMLDMVVYNGSSYICKQECTGVVPTNTTYWMLNASGSAVAYINDIGDVVITNVSNGQVLMYDSATQKWVNGTISTTLSGLTDTQIASLSNGQVLKYNSTSQKWENADEKGGILPHLIVISETGSTVTATKGQTVITATETSTGHFECDLPEFGTWTIDAILGGDDAQVSLVVDTVKVYTVDDSHFHADITVTYPSGATCNLAGEGESYYATGSPYTFTVHHAGNYTITVTYNGQTYTDTVTVSTTGQTFSKKVPTPSSALANDIDFWLWFGGVSGTFSNLSEILANSTALAMLMTSTDAVDYLVRCTEWIKSNALVPVMTSNTTPGGECFGNGTDSTYPPYYAFDGNDSTIYYSATAQQTNIYVGYKFTEATKVNAFKLRVLYSTYTRIKNYRIEASNDNSNWDVLYTGIAEDRSATYDITQKFANNNEYLYYRIFVVDKYGTAGSIAIPTLQFYSEDGVTENQSAMSYIGLNNYCANTLLADADWRDGICDSEYFENVLNVKVPTMTSDTTPSGICSASTSYSGTYPYHAFDNNATTRWISNVSSTNDNSYIGYDFGSDKKIVMAKIDFRCPNSTSSTLNYKIDASNGNVVIKDNLSITMIGTDTHYPTNIIFGSLAEYSDFRIFKKSSNTNLRLSIWDIQFYGREDV